MFDSRWLGGHPTERGVIHAFLGLVQHGVMSHYLFPLCFRGEVSHAESDGDARVVGMFHSPHRMLCLQDAGSQDLGGIHRNCLSSIGSLFQYGLKKRVS